MTRELLKSKIHRATVTEADLHYVGSITIDEELMIAANIVEYEKVAIFNITNGSRIETYVIKGKKGSGVICINGAAAHLVSKDDLVIIVAYTTLDEKDVVGFKPDVILVDENNKVIEKL